MKRIFRKYLISFKLGTLLLIITTFSSSISLLLFFYKVLPEIKKDIFVTAGTSSAFTSSGVLAIISMALFFFYDYASAKKVETIFFEAINND